MGSPGTISTATVATEAIWLHGLVRALGFLHVRPGPTPLFKDNTACNDSNEWESNVIGGRERAKHINIRKHYAHEAIQLGHVCLVRVATADLDQFANVLTRGLQQLQHRACISAIQQRPWPS
jgi:hypothetical protein